MINFKLSAFADEYSPKFDEQLEGLTKNGVKMIEIRGIDGKNVSEISLDEAREVKKKLDAAGISVSAIGSPIGKIKITDPMEPHMELLSHVIAVAKILDASVIRMFSFYIPQGEAPEKYKEEVFARLDMMLQLAEREGIVLCHENERGIYGDTPERCAEILERFEGRMPGVFDHANFITVGCEPYPYAYNLLKKHLKYFHIKDAIEKTIYPAGLGNGRIPETIADIKKDFDGDFILTVEPHLFAFIGLDKLENSDEKIKNPFSDAKEAFSVAIKAIRDIIA